MARDWNPSDAYSVAGHGNPYAMGLPNGELIYEKKLADLIRTDPHWKHRPIVIRGCEVGHGGKQSLAQQLANDLGVDVKAPTEIATWNGMPLPWGGYWSWGLSFPLGGWMKTFTPQRP